MSYKAYITTIKNLRKHPNADRLQLGECFGNTVCVGLDITPDELGVYFPTDGQLSVEFAEFNNLLRKKDASGNSTGGYMDPYKRNVRAIKLRGEKSDGLFLPLSCLEYTGVDFKNLEIGLGFTAINGHDICCKYIPCGRRPNGSVNRGNRTRKKKVPIAPTFAEHADTEQLAYNLSVFRPGDEIEITLKMHGTSHRVAHLPKLTGYTDSVFCEMKNALKNFWYTLLHKEDQFEPEHDGEPVYEYGYVAGTRRTVLENYEGGFYGDNSFREPHTKFFDGKLWAGETVYGEIVSYTTDGTPIMGECTTPKEVQHLYGEKTVFHYGCSPNGSYQTIPGICVYDEGLIIGINDTNTPKPQSEFYVYRMTMTTPDGNVVEYTPDFMRYRCEMMGAKCVPVFDRFIIPDEDFLAFIGETAGEYVLRQAERWYDGPDPIGKTHIREGVVVRTINRPKFTAYKHKNFLFKMMTGIIKEQLKNDVSEDILQEL